MQRIQGKYRTTGNKQDNQLIAQGKQLATKQLRHLKRLKRNNTETRKDKNKTKTKKDLRHS